MDEHSDNLKRAQEEGNKEGLKIIATLADKKARKKKMAEGMTTETFRLPIASPTPVQAALGMVVRKKK